MSSIVGSPWVAALAAVAALAVLWLLVLRYRALERAGTPLPPGAGGARLVGVRATVVVPHRPPGQRGTVHVLGDDWGIADAVDEPLAEGLVVEVREVVGTRLVVVPADRGDTSRPDGRAARDTLGEDPDPTDVRSQ